MKQPKLRIGIMTEAEINFSLETEYTVHKDGKSFAGNHTIRVQEGQMRLDGILVEGDEITFEPDNHTSASFVLSDVTIGVKFHWERKENQQFRGAIQFLRSEDKIIAINILPLEDYLTSVISSEMSATSSIELLKAHAIISRSWLIAQVVKGRNLGDSESEYTTTFQTEAEYIRWYDREDHIHFDVCADDHCQRYQGITRQTSHLVEKAVKETTGQVLMFDNQVCDARFSKSCGGITESFEKVWEPVVHPYLQSVVDLPGNKGDSGVRLVNENEAEKWIRTSPDAFCNTVDRKVLSQVLVDYDRETLDFYRWKVSWSQEELSSLIAKKTGYDFGQILNLVPLERGDSGRIVRLEIVGSKKNWIVGKELEIRKILSNTHLYSSAFVVDRYDLANDVPARFELTGAGWGHGVGLCQIGAAVMGEKGYTHQEILVHYFVNSELKKAY